MPDNLKPEDRRKTMQAVKGKGTSPERRLFSMLAGMRLKGWRKNADDVVGKPDAVFDDAHLALFIDGCFWHGCPYCRRKLPQTNREYWEKKIFRNVERAEQYNQMLTDRGWTVIRIWEHEIREVRARVNIQNKIRTALAKGMVNDKSE